MGFLLTSILTLAIISGQLIRIPTGVGTVTFIDLAVIGSSFFLAYKNNFHFSKPPLFLQFFMGFLIVGLLSLVITPIKLMSHEFLNSLSYLIRLFFYVSLSILLMHKNLSDFRYKIGSSLLFSGITLSFLGILQFILFPDLMALSKDGWDPHFFRTVSTFLDPNFAGAYFVLTILILFQIKINKKWQFLSFIVVYLALLTTFSRSSYSMFLISGISLSFFQKSKKIFFSVLILFLFLLISFQIYTQVVARPKGISREQSASFRLSTWTQGLIIFQNSPILGIGYNSYRYAIRDYNLADQQFIKSHGSSSNDSSLLFVAATTGVVGLSLYFLFLFTLIKYSLKSNFVLTSAILGLLIHSTFTNSLFYPPILLWILLMSIYKSP